MTSLWTISQFADHNFTSDRQQLTAAGVMAEIRRTFSLESEVPPVFADLFPFTISRQCFEGFKVTHLWSANIPVMRQINYLDRWALTC